MQIFEPILKLCYVTKFQDQDRFDSKIAGFQYLEKFEKSLSVTKEVLIYCSTCLFVASFNENSFSIHPVIVSILMLQYLLIYIYSNCPFINSSSNLRSSTPNGWYIGHSQYSKKQLILINNDWLRNRSFNEDR